MFMFQVPCWLVIILVAAALVGGFVVGRLAGGKRRTDRPTTAAQQDDGEPVELYVGNLSYDIGDGDLQKAFAKFGKVAAARIIENKFNGKSKGYGFVEMADRSGSDAAIKAMNGKELEGRKIVVKEARSQPRDR